MIDIKIVQTFVVILIVCCVIGGTYRGLVLEAYGLAKGVLMLLGVILFSPVIQNFLPVQGKMAPALAGILTMVFMGALLGSVGKILKIVDHIPVINKLNKLGGAFFGGMKGILIAGVILWLLEMLQIYKK